MRQSERGSSAGFLLATLVVLAIAAGALLYMLWQPILDDPDARACKALIESGQGTSLTFPWQWKIYTRNKKMVSVEMSLKTPIGTRVKKSSFCMWPKAEDTTVLLPCVVVTALGTAGTQSDVEGLWFDAGNSAGVGQLWGSRSYPDPALCERSALYND